MASSFSHTEAADNVASSTTGLSLICKETESGKPTEGQF